MAIQNMTGPLAPPPGSSELFHTFHLQKKCFHMEITEWQKALMWIMWLGSFSNEIFNTMH